MFVAHHDQGNPAGSIRSASPHIRSAMASVVRSADPYAHRSKPVEEGTAIDAILVADDLSRRLCHPDGLKRKKSSATIVKRTRF
jgi:hypothetical protein